MSDAGVCLQQLAITVTVAVINAKQREPHGIQCRARGTRLVDTVSQGESPLDWVC